MRKLISLAEDDDVFAWKDCQCQNCRQHGHDQPRRKVQSAPCATRSFRAIPFDADHDNFLDDGGCGSAEV